MKNFTFAPLVALSQFSTHTALVQDGASLRYSELDRWSDQLRKQLPADEDLSESCVAILAPSSFAYVAALYAAWKAGAIAVPLQPQHPITELAYILENSRSLFLFVHPNYLSQAHNLVQTQSPRSIRIIPIPFELDTNALTPSKPWHPDQGALMIYTSGTTARPKGVVITAANLNFQIKTLGEAWQWQSTDYALNVLPLHHVHGIVNILLCALGSGATCELNPTFDAERTWQNLTSGQVSVFMAVPTIYAKLVQHWEKQGPQTQSDWSNRVRNLRLMVSGSAALPLPLFERWQMITGHRLLERYGMTEIGMALSNPYDGDRKPRSVGRPLPGVEIRLIEDEVQVKGPGVFREYWGQPELTRQSFTADGWFQTGDQAQVDQAGYYFILGRASQDIIKCGGYKLSALEIEGALLEHPDLLEVAVVGLPDPEWGERVGAVYVWKDFRQNNSDHHSLKTWLRGRIAHYKVPTHWLSVRELPRNAMGKLTKPAIRALFRP